MDQAIIFCASYLFYAVIAGAVARILQDKRLRLSIAYTALIALPLGYALAKIAGHFYGHHQPFAEEGFIPLVPHTIDNAFPSDHTLISGIFASVAFLVDRRFGLFLWMLTLLVGLGRMLAGLHYGVDVLVAAALAVLVVSVAHKMLSWYPPGGVGGDYRQP